MARVQAAYAASAWKRRLIAGQALARAHALVAAPAGRPMRLGALREAWVVFRHGTQLRETYAEPVSGPERVADFGTADAGYRGRGQDARAAAAIASYEQHVAHRPPGWPVAGQAALCVLAAVGRADTIEGDIARLRLLARDMRVSALLDDDEHRRRSAARAARRAVPTPTPLKFRRTLPPRWETQEQRRCRLRDQLLQRGENPADLTIAATLAYRLGLQVAADLVDHDDNNSGELVGARDRVARYREELRRGTWDLPAKFMGEGGENHPPDAY